MCRYNDHAPLENHHASYTFSLLRKPRCNFVEQLPTRRAFRKVVIGAILATDMAQHSEMIKEAKGRVEASAGAHGSGSGSSRSGLSSTPGQLTTAGSVDPARESDRQFLCNLLVHSSDLSSSVHPEFGVVDKWARMVCSEFTAEVQEQRRRGLPISTFMDNLKSEAQIGKLQVSFINYVVTPLWEGLAGILPNARPCLDRLRRNVGIWQARVDAAALVDAAHAADTKEGTNVATDDRGVTV